MRWCARLTLYHFKISVHYRAATLDLDRENGKQKHLYRGAAGIPERARNAVLPPDVAALKQSGCPGPLRYNDGSGQADANITASCVELLRRHLGLASFFGLQLRDEVCQHREGGAEANDHNETHLLAEDSSGLRRLWLWLWLQLRV